MIVRVECKGMNGIEVSRIRKTKPESSEQSGRSLNQRSDLRFQAIVARVGDFLP